MRAFVWTLLTLVTFGPAAAQDSTIKEVLEKQAREIDEMLIAPCCWSQPISQHYSGVAEEMRQGVRRMLAEGKTRQEILDSYVEKYGERILSMPPARGFNLMAYVLPGLVLALGALGLVAAVRRFSRQSSIERSTAPAASAMEGKYAERLARELRELE